MTDSLDFDTVAAQLAEPVAVDAPADAWLARGQLGWGASDIAPLLLALGIVRDAEDAPEYIRKRTRVTTTSHGQPRIIAEKAGLVAPYAAGSAASEGTRRERELLTHWRTLLERGVYYDDAESLVLPRSIRHADSLMRCMWPIVDRHAPVLTATLDAWASDQLGGSLVVELKCSAKERRDLPWWWRWQVVAQLAVTGADYGLLVMGERWSATWHADDGPVRTWVVERDEREIEIVRNAAREGWRRVEQMRGQQ